MLLFTEIHKNLVRIKAPNSVNASLTTMGCTSLPVPRRLANKTYLSYKIHPSNGTKSGFHTKSKKSDLIPTQQFTFIGMEFLTQQEIVRVPVDRV